MHCTSVTSASSLHQSVIPTAMCGGEGGKREGRREEGRGREGEGRREEGRGREGMEGAGTGL